MDWKESSKYWTLDSILHNMEFCVNMTKFSFLVLSLGKLDLSVLLVGILLVQKVLFLRFGCDSLLSRAKHMYL